MSSLGDLVETLITLREFARRIGKSRRQAARYVQAELVIGTRVQKDGQRVVMIAESEVERFLQYHDQGVGQGVGQMPLDTTNPAPPDDQAGDQGHDQPSAHYEQPASSVPMDAFHALLERYDQMQQRMVQVERENMGLRFALEQHRRALTENSETIAEKEARAREAEARWSQALDEIQQARQSLDEERTSHKKNWWRRLFTR
jgi:hypothetical protein